MRFPLFDGLTDAGDLVGWQIVEDENVAFLQLGSQDIQFYIGR